MHTTYEVFWRYMAKIKKKDIVRQLKNEKDASARKNYTFRFNEELLENFRKECSENELTMTEVLEKLIKEFLND